MNTETKQETPDRAEQLKNALTEFFKSLPTNILEPAAAVVGPLGDLLEAAGVLGAEAVKLAKDIIQEATETKRAAQGEAAKAETSIEYDVACLEKRLRESGRRFIICIEDEGATGLDLKALTNVFFIKQATEAIFKHCL